MSMQKTKSLSQLEMKMKVKSLRRHVEIVSQSGKHLASFYQTCISALASSPLCIFLSHSPVCS